jgi:pimeloyl-ACP methyl ester carboxylesterase
MPVALFALIHGGGGSGSCWELLGDELVAAGHQAIAPDLPVEDNSAGTLEYAKVVVKAIGNTTEEVIVVGHSLGGLTVPVVASLRPCAHMVFLGAMVPIPGQTYRSYLEGRPGVLTAPTPAHGYDSLGRRGIRPWEDALYAYYHDCPERLARNAWQQLRPQSVTPFSERCPIATWPDVPGTYILMLEDRSVSQEWSREVSRERLGREPLELAGDHSPFLSRPAALARLLCGLTTGGAARVSPVA